MQPIALTRKIPRRVLLVRGVILAAIILALVVGGYSLGQWFNPGQRITPRTVDNLAEVPTLIRHDAGINSIVFNSQPNTDFSFISSDYDGLIKLWYLDNEVATEEFAMQAGRKIALSADGKLLASLDFQGAAKLWDLTRIKTLFRSLPEQQLVSAISFSPDGQILASGRADGTIQLWHWKSGKPLYTLKAHGTVVISLAFSPDGQTLASSDSDRNGTIKLWNWKTRKLLGTLKGGEYGANLSFSPDGQILASHDVNGTIQLWAWKNGRVSRTLPSSTNDVSSMAFSPDGQILATGSQTGITLFNPVDGTKILTIQDGRFFFAFSPDGQTLASSSDNGVIKLWNRNDGRLIRSFQGREQTNPAMTFSPDGKTLVSAVYGGAITLWNPNDGTKQFTLSMKGAQVFALNPDGQTLAIGSEDKTIKLLSLKYEPKLAQSLKVKLKQGRFVGFSPDQQSLILAGGPEIKQLRLKDHRALTAPKTQPDQFFASFALSPNAQMLAGGGWNQPIHLWNLKDGTLLRTLPKDGLPKDDQSYVASIAFSPDGQQLAAANLFAGKIQLWNLDNGDLIRSLDVNRASRVVFSPDGQLLASRGEDGAIHLWHSQTGQKLRTLKGHGSGINALAFSPDGETLASGSSDQTIKLWRVKRKD